MGFNGYNRLLIIKKVQDDYLKYKTDGVTSKTVYQKYIYPVYFISIATMYNYLAINARKELNQMKAQTD